MINPNREGIADKEVNNRLVKPIRIKLRMVLSVFEENNVFFMQ